MTELARRAGLTKARAFRLLTTLEHRGLIARESTAAVYKLRPRRRTTLPWSISTASTAATATQAPSRIVAVAASIRYALRHTDRRLRSALKEDESGRASGGGTTCESHNLEFSNANLGL
ncbi:helix-turn-helix domain-containing protein [Cupriavidus necator]|uniref:helix-turn-helix domain-containing protein n=1 Tax=Cupriavidus necator TaxID=106590 RepID=UPI0039C089BA